MNYGGNVGGGGAQQQQGAYMGMGQTGPPPQMLMGQMPQQQGQTPQGNPRMMMQRSSNLGGQPHMQMGMGHPMGQPPMTCAPGVSMYGGTAPVGQYPTGQPMMQRGGMVSQSGPMPVTGHGPQTPPHGMQPTRPPMNPRMPYGVPQTPTPNELQQWYSHKFTPDVIAAIQKEPDPAKKSQIYHENVLELNRKGVIHPSQMMMAHGNMVLGHNEYDRPMAPNGAYAMAGAAPGHGQMPPQMSGHGPVPTTNPGIAAYSHAQQATPFTPAKVALNAQLQAQAQAHAAAQSSGMSSGPSSVSSMGQGAPMMPGINPAGQMSLGPNMQPSVNSYGARSGMTQQPTCSAPSVPPNQMLSVPSPATGPIGSHHSATAHSPTIASVGPASQTQQPQLQQPNTPQNPPSVQQPASVPAPGSSGQPSSVSAPNSVVDPETAAIISKLNEMYSEKLKRIVQRYTDDKESPPAALLRLMEILEGRRNYPKINQLESLVKDALDRFGLSASINTTLKDVSRKREKKDGDAVAAAAPPQLTINSAPVLPSAKPVLVNCWNRKIRNKSIKVPEDVLEMFEGRTTAEHTILPDSYDANGRLLAVPAQRGASASADSVVPIRKRKASPDPEYGEKRQRMDSGTMPSVHFADTPRRIPEKTESSVASPILGNNTQQVVDPNSPATTSSSGVSCERIKIECSADTRTPWLMSAVASQELECLTWRVDPDRRPMSSLSPDVVLCFQSKTIACPPLRLLVPASYPLEPAIVQYDRTFPANIAISRQLMALFDEHINMNDSRASITSICEAFQSACEELQRLRTLGQFDAATRRQKQLVA